MLNVVQVNLQQKSGNFSKVGSFQEIFRKSASFLKIPSATHFAHTSRTLHARFAHASRTLRARFAHTLRTPRAHLAYASRTLRAHFATVFGFFSPNLFFGIYFGMFKPESTKRLGFVSKIDLYIGDSRVNAHFSPNIQLWQVIAI